MASLLERLMSRREQLDAAVENADKGTKPKKVIGSKDPEFAKLSAGEQNDIRDRELAELRAKRKAIKVQ